MPTGSVKWFNQAKRFGFIVPDEGDKDVFVHMSAVEQAGLQTLEPDQRVSFDIEEGQHGRTSAVNLKLVE